jgi:hypothetical protein
MDIYSNVSGYKIIVQDHHSNLNYPLFLPYYTVNRCTTYDKFVAIMSTFSSSDEATHSSSSVKNDTPPTDAVQTLASAILWPGVEPSRIGVENLEDGESHITFRLSLRDGRNDGNNGIQEYVLRLPQRGKLIRAVYFLSFLQGYTNIPIAEVVHFDPSPDNAVENPYIIQKHLGGASL